MSDALGNPLAFSLSGGERHDCPHAEPLLQACLPSASEREQVKAVLADKGYDSDALVETVEAMEAVAVIPSRKNRKRSRAHDTELYVERNRIERLFGWLKQYRRVATRYEKTVVGYASFVHMACIMRWLA
ncbi:MAG: hypothetical protein RhofKO_10230 [Rhodothermales bacterium]